MYAVPIYCFSWTYFLSFSFATFLIPRYYIADALLNILFQGEKIGNLFDASKYLIETVLPLESWLGIIDFDDDAVVLSYLTQITSNITRQSLVSHLPTVGSGGTCIPCGIDSALEVS